MTPEMSTNINCGRIQKQSGDDGTVVLVPPYPNEVESFDNSEAYSDLEFVVDGMEKPLKLHRRTLARASQWTDEKLKGRKDTRLEWPYDTRNEMDREALVKALQFCYGETLSIDLKKGECCAMIATLTRLQVTCLGDITELIINYAVEEAKQNLLTGVELLRACTEYNECCNTSQISFDKKLVAVVLTKDNMCDHYKETVDDCLMVLPPEYLMLVEYGEPHTRCSEFCLKMKYVRYHSMEMNREEKQALIGNCDWSTLNSQELRELKLVDIIDKDELLEAHEKALLYCEIVNEQIIETMRKTEKRMEDMVKELEKEKDKQSQRVKELERETEELKKRVERTEKEKEEKVKQMEMDRNRCVQEAEEWKRRAEKAEKEREEESKRARKAEEEREKYRKHAEQVEKEKEKMEQKMEEVERERDMKVQEAGKEKENAWQLAETLDSVLKGNCLQT